MYGSQGVEIFSKYEYYIQKEIVMCFWYMKMIEIKEIEISWFLRELIVKRISMN